MTEDRTIQMKGSDGNRETRDSRARIVPKDLGRLTRPFDVSRKRKCYIVFDKGPPPVLQEVDCEDIVIVDEED